MYVISLVNMPRKHFNYCRFEAHLCDSLDLLWFWLFTFSTELGAVKCDLRALYLAILLFNMRPLSLAACTRLRRFVSCSFFGQLEMQRSLWIHRLLKHLYTIWSIFLWVKTWDILKLKGKTA